MKTNANQAAPSPVKMKRRKAAACAAAALSAIAAAAQVVSVKSPDGRNEIRLDTEPSLSYSVLRDGRQRVAPSPISMEFESLPAIGAAGAKVLECTSRDRRGIVQTPIYKKAQVDERANETRVAFEGGWAVSLVARDDGVAYRFETNFETNQVKVLAESAPVAFPAADSPPAPSRRPG